MNSSKEILTLRFIGSLFRSNRSRDYRAYRNIVIVYLRRQIHFNMRAMIFAIQCTHVLFLQIFGAIESTWSIVREYSGTKEEKC